MADTRCSSNLMVNSDIICSIVCLFLYLKMPLSCGPCINMALRSEAWALIFAFTSLPECLSVCRIVRLFLCSCCAGLCVSTATYLRRKYILPAFGNSHFLQPPSLWQLAPFPGIRALTLHHPINPSTLLSPQRFAQWEQRKNLPKLLGPARHSIKHRLHTYIQH